MDEDEIHFLHSFQDPLKSEALRSTREFTEGPVHWWLWTAPEGYVCNQERKDGGLATVTERGVVT